MRLTIDTKTDSKDEIRKAIRLLMGIVGAGHEVYASEAPQPKQETPSVMDAPSAQVSSLMSIFDTPAAQQETKIEDPEPSPDIPTIEFY